jgi:NAD(P)-dependent dehydrogenase (short-subunit alcohol dehydrogenase family)
VPVTVAWFDSFQGKVVVVTGASSGIGRATALAFAAAGARLALVARRREPLDAVAAHGHGAEALVVPTDVAERALVLPGVVETPMVDAAAADPEFLDLWPSALNMRPSWVVWAVFAAARFRLVEVSVPPGAATLEKLGALAPGVADTIVHWARRVSHWLATGVPGSTRR